MQLQGLNGLNLPPELKNALLAILNQGPQEMPQNPYPAVGKEAFSRMVRPVLGPDGKPARGEFYAADGRPIANNPEDNPGYRHAPWPRMIYKISEYEFETVMVDPKTTEEKPVSKKVRTKDAAAELKAAGWTPKLITKIVQDQKTLDAEKKRGWVETPAEFYELVAAFPTE